MKLNKIRYMVQIPESINGHFIHGAPYCRDLRRPGFYLHVIKWLTPKVKYNSPHRTSMSSGKFLGLKTLTLLSLILVNPKTSVNGEVKLKGRGFDTDLSQSCFLEQDINIYSP